MAKARRKRTRYTDQQRSEILQTAQREKLTAGQVQERFGVTPVTYYSWRKKSGAAAGGARRGRPAGRTAAAGGSIEGQLRAGVQAKVRELLPSIVREEVGAFMDQMFGRGSATSPRRRRRRPGRPRKKK
jgi:transposase-like protein